MTSKLSFISFLTELISDCDAESEDYDDDKVLKELVVQDFAISHAEAYTHHLHGDTSFSRKMSLSAGAARRRLAEKLWRHKTVLYQLVRAD